MSAREAHTNRVLLSGSTTSERIRSQFVDSLNYNFDKSPSYFEVNFNDAEDATGVHIVENSSLPNEKNDFIKIIIMKPGDSIKTGDIITWDDEIWLCTATERYGGIYYRGKIILCSNELKFYRNKVYYSLPCFIMAGSVNYLDLKFNKFLGYSDGRYSCVCPDLGYIKKSDLDLRFIINGSAYKINGVDNITNSGIIGMELIDDEFLKDDNINLGVANYYSNQSVYTVEILNGNYAELNYQNETLQLNILCKKNGVIIDNPEIEYSIDDDYVAEVNDVGLITCVGTGIAVVTAKFMDAITTINIRGVMAQQDNYEIVFVNPVESIKLGQTKSFNIKVLNNGIEVDKYTTWNLSNEDGSGEAYAEIVDSDNKTCTVKAINKSSYVNKYVVLKCRYSTVFEAEHRIRIANLY